MEKYLLLEYIFYTHQCLLIPVCVQKNARAKKSII